MSPLLELDGIGKTYELETRLLPRLLGRSRPLRAVDQVDLSVERGAVLGLVGESGCGKSTLARIILKLETPTAGRVLFDGHDLVPLAGAALKPFRRRLQMVFQDANSSLNPRKTAARLIGEALALVEVPPEARRERAGDLLALVGLDGAMLDRYPHEISGGQRQRLAIARALAMGPDLLVADEPVSSLDVSLQAQILRLLMDLRDRLGLTMIFISHDLALVHHLCSSVAVMSAGRIVEQGPPARILHDPHHEYTRKLLASVPRRRARPKSPHSSPGAPPMTDALGWRAKFGVLGPSTNTIVQPDFDAMRPAGVTNHYSRIYTPDANAVSNESFRAGTETIAGNVLDAVRSVMTCKPDYLVMGMSAVTFFDGAKGADAFVRKVEDEAGIKISIGSHACTAALRAYGGVKTLAILSPYWPVMNTEVAGYFNEMGFQVKRDICLQCRSWTGIAEVPTSLLRETLRDLDGDDIDAIVQVGTNLSMVRLAAAAETWLGKPVIAINTATYWHALRANGITDKMDGFGQLLARF